MLKDQLPLWIFLAAFSSLTINSLYIKEPTCEWSKHSEDFPLPVVNLQSLNEAIVPKLEANTPLPTAYTVLSPACTTQKFISK